MKWMNLHWNVILKLYAHDVFWIKMFERESERGSEFADYGKK